jgi:hypothetical protein
MDLFETTIRCSKNRQKTTTKTAGGCAYGLDVLFRLFVAVFYLSKKLTHPVRDGLLEVFGFD